MVFLMMEAICIVEAPGPDYPVTRRHVLEERSPQPRGLDHVNTRKMSRPCLESNQLTSIFRPQIDRRSLPLRQLLTF